MRELLRAKMPNDRRLVFTYLLSFAVFGLQIPSSIAEDRSFDGTGNNLLHNEWGSAGTNFERMAPVDYADQVSLPNIAGRPDPRSVSVALFRQEESRPNARKLSGYVYAFGQLLSHDMQQSMVGQDENIPFRIPSNDDIFFPGQVVRLTRSLFDIETGTGPDNPRQQINFSTAFIDASPIYGANDRIASIIRGGPANPVAKLRTSNDINGDGQNLLPRNAFGPDPDADFVAGDSRVNDNAVLTSLQILFMREHNRLVDELTVDHPTWNQEELYQRARKVVGAQFQVITYNEFLPALLGPHAPRLTGNYDPELNPTVFNEFPTVFLRIGHSMLTDSFLRIENDGQPAPEGPILLEDAFFNPAAVTTSRDVDLFLKGLTVETQEETDLQLSFAMRLAFLGAIDIQRGRDHGLPDYNSMREAYHLPRVTSFDQMTPDEEIQQALEDVYGDVDSIDSFVGALLEEHLPGASVGPLVAAGYVAQFDRLRDGDRFWYENDPDFSFEELAILRQTKLPDIILRNTGVRNISDNVFFTPTVPEPGTATMLAGAMLTWLWSTQKRKARVRS